MSPEQKAKNEAYCEWFKAVEELTLRNGYFFEFAKATVKATAELKPTNSNIENFRAHVGIQMAEAFANAAGMVGKKRTTYIDGVLTSMGGRDEFSQLILFQAKEILQSAVANKYISKDDYCAFYRNIEDAVQGGAAGRRAAMEANFS